MFKGAFIEKDGKMDTLTIVKMVLKCILLLILSYSFFVEDSWYTYIEGEAPLNKLLGFIIAAAVVYLYVRFGRIISFTIYFAVFVICYIVSYGITRNLVEIIASLLMAAVVRYVLHKRI